MTKPLRILVVIPSMAASDGGPSIVLRATSKALARRGVGIDLVTTGAREEPRFDRQEWEEMDGYHRRDFPRLGKWNYKISLALVLWFWRYGKEYDFVHLHSVFNFPILAVAVLCRLKQIPYGITPHGMLEPWALANKGWKKQASYRLIERPLVLRGARFLQALNQLEAANIRKLQLGVQVVVIPNGVDVADKISNDRQTAAEVFLNLYPQAREKRLILFLHRIDPKKGIDLLAKAYALVHAEFPDTTLILAGPDNIGYLATARELFKERGVLDAVVFTGMLEGIEKEGAFAASSLFVLPSYSEGFSMAVLEAMAAGLPCVITMGCNFPESAEAGAAFVVEAEPTAFAAALKELLADEGKGLAMGERARSFVLAYYTWEEVAHSLEGVYHTAVTQSRTRR